MKINDIKLDNLSDNELNMTVNDFINYTTKNIINKYVSNNIRVFKYDKQNSTYNYLIGNFNYSENNNNKQITLQFNGIQIAENYIQFCNNYKMTFNLINLKFIEANDEVINAMNNIKNITQEYKNLLNQLYNNNNFRRINLKNIFPVNDLKTEMIVNLNYLNSFDSSMKMKDVLKFKINEFNRRQKLLKQNQNFNQDFNNYPIVYKFDFNSFGMRFLNDKLTQVISEDIYLSYNNDENIYDEGVYVNDDIEKNKIFQFTQNINNKIHDLINYLNNIFLI